jgi:hypothetical protein
MELDVYAQQRAAVRERRVEEANTYDAYLDNFKV